MPREPGLLETIALQADIPPGKVLRVLECSFRELHRRIYEYDSVNGDYICEELLHELSEPAWIHLYLFVVFCRIKYGADFPQDVISESTIQLQYLGESNWWQRYFDETKEWKMSRHLRDLLEHDIGPQCGHL